MVSFFLSLGAFIIWVLSIIIMYYSTFYSNISHIESSSGYAGYLATIIGLYALYKGYTIFVAEKKVLKWNFWSILGLTLLHVLIICGFYSTFPEVRQSPLMSGGSVSAVTLFFHILSLLVYPLALVVITRSAGYSILRLLVAEWGKIDLRIRIGVEISVGFFVFVIGLMMLAWVHMFHLTGLLILLWVMTVASYSWLRETWNDMATRSVEIDNHSSSGSTHKILNLNLLSIEFAFFFLTFLLAVSLINVIRPMPIGWDDLGVYMNFPKMIALSWELLKWAQMYSWQLITSTGFLFGNNASQAFYLNQLGGILAVIALTSILSFIFEKEGKKALISLPILFALVYYAMPMTVFQQAKDMKLDPAYFFFSISGFALLFTLWKEEISLSRKNLMILAIAWVLIGFTFSVKFTSIMLILWGLWLIAYRLLSLSWYIGYFFLFLAVFTYADLWKIVNVPMPRNNGELMHTIGFFLWSVGILSILSWLYFHGKQRFWEKLFSWIRASGVFLIAVGIGCAPWLVKNASEIWSLGLRSNPMSILNWSGWVLTYSYETLYTKEELKEKEKSTPVGITTEWQSDNEDMGRYFGYDTGINNYLKLPPNLTFQKNQAGEFTDITYFFLAFFPAALLFARSRRSLYSICIGGVLIFSLLYYFIDTTGIALTRIFSYFTLGMNGGIMSYGYALLLLLNFLFIGATHFLLEKNETNRKIREMTAFMWVYAFFFMISAFGIVWYGIVIYFGFFVIIGLALSEIIDHSKDEEKDDERMNLFLTASTIVFVFIGVYFIRSAFPHGWNNLKSAYYNEYKYHTLSQEESIFAYRSDYLIPIATLNVKDTTKLFEGLKEKMTSPWLKEKLANINMSDVGLEAWHTFVLQNRNSSDMRIRNDARLIGKTLYDNILYPKAGNTNTGGIYRIGTFMTYLIDKNRERYFEDSLIFSFDTYFYAKSPETTIERMKKLGLKYLLVDLNAATIDRDPRHALTARFEKLLLTMRARNLRLVATDNFCLELAIGEYKKWAIKSDEEFLSIAATNSESYKDGVAIPRGQKLYQCQQYIINLLNSWKGSDYSVINSIKNDITTQGAAQDPQKLSQILMKYTGQSWFTLFEITDTPVETQIPTTASGTTLTWSQIQKK